MIRKLFIRTPLGRKVYKLLHDPISSWSLDGIDIKHSSGLILDVKPGGGFDVKDKGPNDYNAELPWLERYLMWPLVAGIIQRLEYPEFFEEGETDA